MRLFYEWGTRQINKHGEELCGDNIAISRNAESVTLALSDGLGSGVKANILASLTTRIAMHLLTNDLPIGEVVQTLSETLPVCEVRKLAYSTFAIAQFATRGCARLVEFDTPPAMVVRRRRILSLAYEERIIGDKKVREAVVDLLIGDWVVFVSDGVLNAGIGGVYPLGWGWDQAARFVAEHAHPNLTAEELAESVAEAVNELYAGAPGDDVSVAVIKIRHKRIASVLTGPPADAGEDSAFVRRFLDRPGRLAVCGGTTAKIVSRHLGQPLEVDLGTMSPDVPPLARVEGLDLVTEGILTLTRVSQMLRSGVKKEEIDYKTDGAAELLRLLLSVDSVHFLVGRAVNPAHQNPDLPQQLGIRTATVREIAQELRKRGKEATVTAV